MARIVGIHSNLQTPEFGPKAQTLANVPDSIRASRYAVTAVTGGGVPILIGAQITGGTSGVPSGGGGVSGPMTLSGPVGNTAVVGDAYTSIAALGGAFVPPVTITGLPSWVSYTISGYVVTLTGTPTVAGTYSGTMTATDSRSGTPQVVHTSYTITVFPAGTSSQTFTASGTFTPPSGITSVMVLCVGGGGGGENGANADVTNGSGGAAVLASVSVSSPVTVTIGAGGAAATAGGATSFGATTANGGAAGTGGAGTSLRNLGNSTGGVTVASTAYGTGGAAGASVGAPGAAGQPGVCVVWWGGGITP